MIHKAKKRIYKYITTILSNVIMVVFVFALSSLTQPTESDATNSPYVVYGVKTDFPMNNDNQYPPKDYYINMGLAQGIKIGSQLEVYRIMTTDDDINNQKMDNISFKIAKLKVIHAEENISVARLDEMASKDDRPYDAYNTVMVGDLIEVGAKH